MPLNPQSDVLKWMLKLWCFYQSWMELCGSLHLKVISLLFWVNSLVTAVPVPLISGLDRKEVSGPLVLHFLGEPQEDSEVDVLHGGSISRPWMDHRGNGGHKLRWKVLLAELPGATVVFTVQRVCSIVLNAFGKTNPEHLCLGRTSCWRITAP